MPSSPPEALPEDTSRAPALLTPELLRRYPLPQPEEEGDKEERGQVLVVGGSAEMPGAILLAGTAALRAGAGKLRIATGRGIALGIALAIPEARVFGLPEAESGAIDRSAAAAIAAQAARARAVLIGPGMLDERRTGDLVRDLLPRLPNATWVLDAAPLACVAGAPDALHPLAGRVVLTPHAGEMAGMLGLEKSAVMQDPAAIVRRASREWRAVVALKGADTFIAAPDGELFCNRAGNVGLATSGSGDTLAGIVAGLAARGAEPLTAALWGVYLHACAGDRLARRMGRLGFLARELLDEIPPLMAELAGDKLETAEQI